MRQIKFRFWNGEKMLSEDEKAVEEAEKLMSNPQFQSSDPITVLSLIVSALQYSPQNKIKLQFTGLLDKNGKEIYEGDLLKITEIDEDSCFGREDTEVVEVSWIEDIAQFRAVFKSGRRVELHFVVQLPTVVSCEVIGNIHENPDLLK